MNLKNDEELIFENMSSKEFEMGNEDGTKDKG